MDEVHNEGRTIAVMLQAMSFDKSDQLKEVVEAAHEL